MNIARIFVAGTAALALTLAGTPAQPTLVAQSKSATIVTVFVKSSGPRLDKVVSGLSRERSARGRAEDMCL